MNNSFMGEVEGDSPLHSHGSLVKVLAWVGEELLMRNESATAQESALTTGLSGVLQG